MVAKKRQKRNNQGFGQDEKEKSVSKDVKQTSRPVTPEERGKAIFNHIEAAVDAEIANQELQEALLESMGGIILRTSPSKPSVQLSSHSAPR